MRSGDGTQTHETPNKNEYSHPHDALQYLLLGSGELATVLNKNNRGRAPNWGEPIAGYNYLRPDKGVKQGPRKAHGVGSDIEFEK